MRQTWTDFLSKSMNPDFLQPKYPEDILYWLNYHTREWPARFRFSNLEVQLEARIKELVRITEERERQGERVECKWVLNQTPDGPI